MFSRCRVVGCGKPARGGTEDGLDTRFCRRHSDHYARHGSPYKRSAKELAPYRKAAIVWLELNAEDQWVRNAIDRVVTLYGPQGPTSRRSDCADSHPRNGRKPPGRGLGRPRSIPAALSLPGLPSRWLSRLTHKRTASRNISAFRQPSSFTGWHRARISDGEPDRVEYRNYISILALVGASCDTSARRWRGPASYLSNIAERATAPRVSGRL